MALSIHHPRYRALRAHMRQMRMAAELTQAGLAERLGEEQSYISKIERGERFVDVLFYVDWCRACGVPASSAVTELMADE